MSKLLLHYRKMPINSQEVLSLVTQLCEEENLRITVKESLMGGALAGTTTVIGGILGGPIGLAIGKYDLCNFGLVDTFQNVCCNCS